MCSQTTSRGRHVGPLTWARELGDAGPATASRGRGFELRPRPGQSTAAGGGRGISSRRMWPRPVVPAQSPPAPWLQSPVPPAGSRGGGRGGAGAARCAVWAVKLTPLQARTLAMRGLVSHPLPPALFLFPPQLPPNRPPPALRGAQSSLCREPTSKAPAATASPRLPRAQCLEDGEAGSSRSQSLPREMAASNTSPASLSSRPCAQHRGCIHADGQVSPSSRRSLGAGQEGGISVQNCILPRPAGTCVHEDIGEASC